MTTPTPAPDLDEFDDDITVDLDELVDDIVERIPRDLRARLYRGALAVSTVLGGLMVADVIPDGGFAGKAAAGVAWLVAVLSNGMATAYTRPAGK